MDRATNSTRSGGCDSPGSTARAGKTSPIWESVQIGDRLPTRPIGPHTLSTFASEWRAYIFTVWGSTVQEGYDHIPEAGWLPEMDRHIEEAKLDPSMGDGLYQGPSRGHTDEAHAR